MGSRRTVILLAAAVVAAIAALSSFSYLNGVQERANRGARLVSVYIVKKDVQKGLPGEQAISQGFVKADKIPEKVRPNSALTDINTIKGKVAVGNLSSNQVVVDGTFVDPKVEQVTNAQRIPSGQVGVTISVDQVHGVAGLVVPGDKVNIMVAGGEGPEAGEHLLYQNVNVLFVGTNAAPEPGETKQASADAAAATPATTGLITFSVPPVAAQKIAFVAGQPNTSLYLTLVPPNNQPVAPTVVNNGNLFTGGSTPYEG